MNSTCKQLHALFLREWILLRTWVIGFTLVVLAGPIINLLNEFGTSPSVRLTSVFKSIYLEGPPAEIVAGSRHIMATFNSRPDVPFRIYGAPPASLWVLGIAISLAALLATYERNSSAIVDTLSLPIRKSAWLTGKFLFGVIALICMVGLRTILLGISNLLSPWHFSATMICLSGIMNLALGLVTFAIVFFISILVNNFLVAWALGLLALSFLLAFGAVVGFLGFVPQQRTATYYLEHHVVLKLSPFWFTDYMTRTSQQYSSPAFSVQNPMPASSRMVSVNLSTAVGHPWLLAVGAVLVSFILYLCSRWMFAKIQAEDLGNIFVSPTAMHFCLTFVSIVAGSVPAQIISNGIGHASLPVFLGAGIVCYSGLWVIYRQVKATHKQHLKMIPFRARPLHRN